MVIESVLTFACAVVESCVVVGSLRLIAAVLACLSISGCTLPRGAALTGEILREQQSDTPTFQIVPVTRANLPGIAGWPVTGWSGGYRWLDATRGPDSPLVRQGDSIDLVIWDSQENSLLTSQAENRVVLNGLSVSPEGHIFVPYLDEIGIAGLTPDQARRKMQDALMPIVPSAQVQLAVTGGRQSSVDLVAGVARPGTYPLPDRNHTILSVIAAGGGISPGLRNPLVRVIREGRSYEIRADRLFSEAARNAVLRGGDKIVIEEDSRYFTSLGATGTERLIHFEKEDITALEALSIIGGLTDSRANPKGVIILRDFKPSQVRTDGRGPSQAQVIYTFDLTTADGLFAARGFRVNPRDTVLATESPVTSAQTVVGLLGSLVGLAGRVGSF